MPLYLLILAVQIGLAVHVARTGRSLYWIMIIVFVPVVGAVAYLIAELLPEMRNNPRAQRAVRRAAAIAAPGAERRRLEEKLLVADTIRNRAALAEVCLRNGAFDRAAGLYASCLTGVHGTDPDLLLGLARAHSGLGKHAACRRSLDELIAANPDYKSPEGHLLYAATLEALGEHDAAMAEYDVLATSYPGEEARVRRAKLLIRLERHAEARHALEDLLRRARAAPDFYRAKEGAWLDEARTTLASLGKG